MGLDAKVRCRCWEEGKLLSPPPCAEHVRLDEEGWLRLELAWDGNEEKHRAFDEWLRTCCAHPDMEQASEWIASWSGYRLFQQQLRGFGLARFPTLAEVLPENNGGQAAAEKAAAALKELDDFCLQNFGGSSDLVATDVGKVVFSYIEAYDGLFLLSPEGRAGVDPSGFFVQHKIGDKEREVFRSMRFSQEQIREKEFRLTDVMTGFSIVTPLGVPVYPSAPSGDTGKWEPSYPSQFQVERRPIDFTDFLYILEPLQKVFRASLETGNPVCWC